MHKIGVLVSGRGSNLQAIMDRIADGYLPLEIAVVISDKPDAFALERAQKADIKTVAVERKACASKEEFEAKINAALEAEGCELVVLAGFMRILSADFVNKWLHGQKQAVDYGVKFSGCTVHFVDAGTDSGPIILQKVVPVMDDDTEDTLADRILVQEHIAMPEALKLWAEGKLTIEGRKVKVKA